jgi:hypothetical protein
VNVAAWLVSLSGARGVGVWLELTGGAATLVRSSDG